VHATTWLLAAISILIWRFILPVTQPEQQRRRVAEQLIIARDFPAAFMFMSKHEQTDFPPHWSPPPHVAQPNPVPPINDLIEVLIHESPAEWVRAIFLEKFRNTTEQTLTRYGIVSDERLSSTLRILDRLPLSEWLPDDEWRREEAIGFLRKLSSNSNRVLSESDKVCLLRILETLPPLATTEDQPTDQPTDPKLLDDVKSE
jgi:hypothetical protein